MISLGLISMMFAIVFDYSRWISNWAVCLFLILHAVKILPASQRRAADTRAMIGMHKCFRLDRNADPARRDPAVLGPCAVGAKRESRRLQSEISRIRSLHR